MYEDKLIGKKKKMEDDDEVYYSPVNTGEA